eukprot:TRINITY_DN845_c0_g1_i2.p1 TRINITY_DN845_c0_g1~~TRINITY_DN845_c0_g1_i2.p1  ORF type:complete len:340 (-),score=79.78 TRINITY_DN845_c0_g1_i2:466-1485(-)
MGQKHTQQEKHHHHGYSLDSLNLYQLQKDKLEDLWRDVFRVDVRDKIEFELFQGLFRVEGDLGGLIRRMFDAGCAVGVEEGEEVGDVIGLFQFGSVVEGILRSTMNFLFLMYCDRDNDFLLRRESFEDMLYELYCVAWLVKEMEHTESEFKFEKTKFFATVSSAVIDAAFGEQENLSQEEFTEFLSRTFPSIGNSMVQFIETICFPPEERDDSSVDSSDGVQISIKPEKVVFPPYLRDVKDSSFKSVKYELPWFLESMTGTNTNYWSILYSFGRDGVSFNRLCSHIVDYGGPTVVLVRDKEGFVFGIYTPKHWKNSVKYRKDEEGFIFVLKPHFKVIKF